MDRWLQAVLWGGGIAGTLDILFAVAFYGWAAGLSPLQVLQSVAAGWTGRDAAHAGGLPTAALGLASHFAIALVMSAVFATAALGLRFLTAQALLSGFLYGLLLYVAMNYVVVPLSAAHSSQHFAADLAEAISRLKTAFGSIRPKDPLLLAGALFAHTCLVGIPEALAARRFLN